MQFGQNLEAYKKSAVKNINDQVGEVRLKYITNITGQSMTYEEKRKEAHLYKSMAPNYPTDLSSFTYLGDAVGIDAPTALEVADMWIDLQEQWKMADGPIEKSRRQHIVLVNNANTRAEIDIILNQFHQAISQF